MFLHRNHVAPWLGWSCYLVMVIFRMILLPSHVLTGWSCDLVMLLPGMIMLTSYVTPCKYCYLAMLLTRDGHVT